MAQAYHNDNLNERVKKVKNEVIDNLEVLDYLRGIACLEKPFADLVNTIQRAAVALSSGEVFGDSGEIDDEQLTADIDREWNYIAQLTDALKFHLLQAIDYHKFHRSMQSVVNDIDKISDQVEQAFRSMTTTTRLVENQARIATCQQLQQLIQGHCKCLVDAGHRITSLLEQSSCILPIDHLMTHFHTYSGNKCQGRLLTNLTLTDGTSFERGELVRVWQPTRASSLLHREWHVEKADGGTTSLVRLPGICLAILDHCQHEDECREEDRLEGRRSLSSSGEGATAGMCNKESVRCLQSRLIGKWDGIRLNYAQLLLPMLTDWMQRVEIAGPRRTSKQGISQLHKLFTSATNLIQLHGSDTERNLFEVLRKEQNKFREIDSSVDEVVALTRLVDEWNYLEDQRDDVEVNFVKKSSARKVSLSKADRYFDSLVSHERPKSVKEDILSGTGLEKRPVVLYDDESGSDGCLHMMRNRRKLCWNKHQKRSNSSTSQISTSSQPPTSQSQKEARRETTKSFDRVGPLYHEPVRRRSSPSSVTFEANKQTRASITPSIVSTHLNKNQRTDSPSTSSSRRSRVSFQADLRNRPTSSSIACQVGRVYKEKCVGTDFTDQDCVRKPVPMVINRPIYRTGDSASGRSKVDVCCQVGRVYDSTGSSTDVTARSDSTCQTSPRLVDRRSGQPTEAARTYSPTMFGGGGGGGSLPTEVTAPRILYLHKRNRAQVVSSPESSDHQSYSSLYSSSFEKEAPQLNGSKPVARTRPSKLGTRKWSGIDGSVEKRWTRDHDIDYPLVDATTRLNSKSPSHEYEKLIVPTRVDRSKANLELRHEPIQDDNVVGGQQQYNQNRSSKVRERAKTERGKCGRDKINASPFHLKLDISGCLDENDEIYSSSTSSSSSDGDEECVANRAPLTSDRAWNCALKSVKIDFRDRPYSKYSVKRND